MVRKIFMVATVVLCLGLAAGAWAQTVPPTEKAVAPTAKPADITKALHKGGFKWTTEDGKFSLRLFAATQFRYTYMTFDDDIQGNQEDYSNFYMRRARLWWDGHAYDPNFTYYFHLQLEPQSSVNLHDAWIQYKFSDLVNIGAGRNKIPYGLEFLNSGFGLHFVDRSVMYGETDVNAGGGSSKFPGGGNGGFGLTQFNSKGFATGGLSLFRSQGLSLSGLREKEGGGAFEYQVGVWNGRATKGASNFADKMLWSARAGWYPFGFINWLQQGDVKDSKTYKMGIVGSYYTTSDAKNNFDESGYNLAIQNRYRGFSADFEYGTETFDYDAYADDFDRLGWRADFGYFVVPKKVEVVARYAEIDRLEDATPQLVVDSGLGFVQVMNDAGDFQAAMEDKISEISLGLNFYINEGHQHKLFFDVSQLTRSFEEYNGFDPSDQEDTRFRTMLQFKF